MGLAWPTDHGWRPSHSGGGGNRPMIRILIVLTLVMGAGLARADDTALRDALIARQDKPVTVMLGSGQELSGKVKAVGGASLVLTELRGKEFFDAVVDLQDVEAVVYRVRDR